MKADGITHSPLMEYEHRSVVTTWTISFESVKSRSKHATNLLRLWAFVNNRDLWHGLFQAAAGGGKEWPGWLSDIAGNEIDFLDAVHLLHRYSIIEKQKLTASGYSITQLCTHGWHIYKIARRGESSYS
jgi:hypothetical protein